MDNRIQNAQLAELIQSQSISPAAPPATSPTAPAGADFDRILQDQLKLSGHAQTRMSSRNIELNQDEWQRVLGGVQKAAAKGAKESLVMVDNVALVVSVKNRTVITAVDKDSLKDNVFTNIDSAVIV
jgi:flagellar operon protein